MKIIVFILTYLSLATIVCADNQIYAVQVLMARQYENAVYGYEKLKDQQDVRIEKINDAYVVRIGAYQTKSKAISLLKQLRMTYTDAFLIKYVIDKKQIIQGNHSTGHQNALKASSAPSTNAILKDSDIQTHPPTSIPISPLGKRHEAPKTQEEPEAIIRNPKEFTGNSETIDGD